MRREVHGFELWENLQFGRGKSEWRAVERFCKGCLASGETGYRCPGEGVTCIKTLQSRPQIRKPRLKHSFVINGKIAKRMNLTFPDLASAADEGSNNCVCGRDDRFRWRSMSSPGVVRSPSRSCTVASLSLAIASTLGSRSLFPLSVDP